MGHTRGGGLGGSWHIAGGNTQFPVAEASHMNVSRLSRKAAQGYHINADDHALDSFVHLRRE